MDRNDVDPFFCKLVNLELNNLELIQLHYYLSSTTLQLNNVDVHLYRDAISGRDIVECQTAVCAIKPCRNGAVCTQHEESG